jgi:uncharacterized protein YdeI (YjbR/CyaY-like superfamily)
MSHFMRFDDGALATFLSGRRAGIEAAKADGRWGRAYRMAKSEPPADLLAAIGANEKARATYEKLDVRNRSPSRSARAP